MNIIKDIYETNRSIISKAVKLAVKNWSILFTGILYSIVSIFLWQIASIFWILAGIVVTLVQSMLLSNYLYLIENIIRYGKITLDDFKKGFTIYIWKIYGMLVVIWFANYGLNLFFSPILRIRIGFVSILLLLQLAAFILLNCLPEVIYQKQYAIGETFSYCFSFIKENWIDWFAPSVILGVLFYSISGKVLTWNILLSRLSFSLSMNSLIAYVIGQFLLSFSMIYRGLLFDILSTTSRRKRMFMRNVIK